MSASSELKACPFCGGSDLKIIETPVSFSVSCGNCVINGHLGTTELEAITAWNTRPHPAPSEVECQGHQDEDGPGVTFIDPCPSCQKPAPSENGTDREGQGECPECGGEGEIELFGLDKMVPCENPFHSTARTRPSLESHIEHANKCMNLACEECNPQLSARPSEVGELTEAVTLIEDAMRQLWWITSGGATEPTAFAITAEEKLSMALSSLRKPQDTGMGEV